jgi:hypothetical protein
MNKIEPHYVDFNTAKLLKEKGFNLKTDTWYDKEGGIYGEGEGATAYKFHLVGECYAPEQW